MNAQSYLGQNPNEIPQNRINKEHHELAVDTSGHMAWVPLRIHPNTITENTTIPSTANAISTGPITIADGVTITVESGATWTVV